MPRQIASTRSRPSSPPFQAKSVAFTDPADTPTSWSAVMPGSDLRRRHGVSVSGRERAPGACCADENALRAHDSVGERAIVAAG